MSGSSLKPSLITLIGSLLLTTSALAQNSTVRTVTTLPATCNGGTAGVATDEVFLVTGTVGLYTCNATNTWQTVYTSPWSALTNPTGNLSLAMGLNLSTWTAGDFGSSPVTGIFNITDSASTTTDTSVNLYVNTGASSKHSPVEFAIEGVPQETICWQAGPQGETVIGSAVTCPNITQSPFAKLVVESSTAAHTVERLYQGTTAATGNMVEWNSATTGTGFDFFTACAGANPVGGSADTGCDSGTVVTDLRGDGLFTTTAIATNALTLGSSSGCLQATAGVVNILGSNCSSGGGGGALPAGNTNDVQINGGSSTFAAVSTSSALTGQFLAANNAAAPTVNDPGVTNNVISGTTDTILCDQTTTLGHRGTSRQYTSASAVAVTLPDVSTAACANFYMKLEVTGAGTVTFTRTGSNTIQTVTGSSAPAPTTSFALTTGQHAYFHAGDNSSYWLADETTGGGGSSVTLQTNGTNNTSQTTLNFITSTVNASGLTVTPSNPATGNEKMEITGTASTATALAATPTQCTNQFATGVAASGNANCASVTFDNVDMTNPTADATFTMPATSTTGWTHNGTAPASVSTGTGTNGSSVFVVNAATGGADSATSGTAGIGGSPSITAGTGGAETGTTGVGGQGGTITLTSGTGGASTTGANDSAGGNITLATGSNGTGGTLTANVSNPGTVNITLGQQNAPSTTYKGLNITQTYNNASATGSMVQITATETVDGALCYFCIFGGSTGTSLQFEVGSGLGMELASNAFHSTSLTGVTQVCGSSAAACEAGANQWVGGTIFEGPDNSNTLSGAIAGAAVFRAGGLAGSTANAAALEGITSVMTAYRPSTVTQWNAVCATTTAQTVTNCGTTLANDFNIIGVDSGGIGTASAGIITEGNTLLNLDGALTNLGDTVCLSTTTAGDGHDSGGTAACASGPTLGSIVADSGSVRIFEGNNATPQSVTMSTTLVEIQIHIR